MALCLTTFCPHARAIDYEAKVAAQGVTTLAHRFGSHDVSIKITTHIVQIGKEYDPAPEKRLTSCTYSRVPCSLVDLVEITVHGSDVFVPRSAFADLADVGAMTLRQNKDGRLILALIGGDASESYTAEITFDKTRVRQRTKRDEESGEVMQRTLYFPQKVFFN